MLLGFFDTLIAVINQKNKEQAWLDRCVCKNSIGVRERVQCREQSQNCRHGLMVEVHFLTQGMSEDTQLKY